MKPKKLTKMQVKVLLEHVYEDKRGPAEIMKKFGLKPNFSHFCRLAYRAIKQNKQPL
jgi:hypothetical protein